MTAPRVLILDDDELVAATLHAMVEAIGAQARATSDAERFFSALETWQPTHILLDLNMPNLDGMEVIAELATRASDATDDDDAGVSSTLPRAPPPRAACASSAYSTSPS